GVHATGAPEDGALAVDPIAGVFEATAIDLYTDGAFLDEVPLTIGTHGDNAAVASVADGVWALRLDLRLAFGLEGVAAGGGTLDTILELATCEAGGELAPPTTCGDTWPDDVVAPAVAVTRWDADSGALTLGFDLAPALILAYVAPEYRDAAEALLVGPVTVRVAFARR
ncbi:MAG: hypothetical protein KC635_01385, partial [Myxococcales bacterium]|nr:hypothetical protein [Myxococcales bacterium]